MSKVKTDGSRLQALSLQGPLPLAGMSQRAPVHMWLSALLAPSLNQVTHQVTRISVFLGQQGHLQLGGL